MKASTFLQMVAPVWVAFFASALMTCVGASAQAGVTPGELRCEHLANPLGIDVTEPRLSWILDSGDRGEHQTAYQILVASSLERLAADEGDLWDSGRVESDQSIHVRYAGRPLTSGQQVYWKVRVWDRNGEASTWSEPARWSMGLLKPDDWRGEWIGLDEEEDVDRLTDCSWIWFPEADSDEQPPVGRRYFRRRFELPAEREVRHAELLLAADNEFACAVNGQHAGHGTSFRAATAMEVTHSLQTGNNVIAAWVENHGSDPNPAGLVGRLRIEFATGEPLVIPTDAEWRTTDIADGDWTGLDFDDSQWVAARVLGPVGMQPWGEVAGAEERRLPARMLRKEFGVTGPVARAMLYVSGQGVSECYLNGEKVGDHVLSPALTEYPQRVFYVTYDVTDKVREGDNALGVWLGNGRYYAPRLRVPTETRTYGYPKVLLQLEVEYANGTRQTIASDESWKLTTEGPILANNEYDGEEYDARREMAGWASAGFDDSAWLPVEVVAAPGGKLAAQMVHPIRVTETLKPISVNEVEPGVFIFDMGQNMVGWCRLRVSGPAGTQVSLRHAETLKPDGTLYLENLRSCKVTDTYTLKGEGTEVYEPRFVYHGFRYVELTGYPGQPTLDTIEGRVVHDDMPPAGEFACSHPLINRIYRNIVWGVRGNYRSIPTDCPQRDERQGWLGDRSAESKGETYLFDVAAFYSKWCRDMSDAQKESGSIPDVCPSYWPLYNDNVTWPASAVIIPGAMYEQYADEAILARQYPTMAKWIEHMTGYIEDGIITRDNYGDWCVPPEDPELIHSNDPARKTAPGILATSYFHHCLKLMAQYAEILDKPEDARRYTALAEELRLALNERFYDEQKGYYDNGSQTSCVLPLAFDMVPEGERQRVFAHLVHKITEETDGHIGTGLVGGQWLNRTLTGGGRPDLVYGFATHTTYPSWGYMVEQDATTIWELWNGDTANPAMNSHNHVMLVGDLVIWLYEDLAGIKSDPALPGFKHIIMKPHPVGDLNFVRASHRSPYGLISSHWQRDGERFDWQITVPANTTATVSIPATGMDAVTESGNAAVEAEGVAAVGFVQGRAVFEVQSGSYRFISRLPGQDGQ